jgi:hypothetical protein
MSEQNFQNHSRYVVGFHFITSTVILAVIIGSFVNLYHAAPENHYSAALICVISLLLVSFFWYTRTFALKAQDRAIRAEEGLRYFILTGKALPSAIRMSQIIALRFASDEEMPGLVQRAVNENLSSADIKKAIQNWRADNHRV